VFTIAYPFASIVKVAHGTILSSDIISLQAGSTLMLL
jgi:hypothetical protein